MVYIVPVYCALNFGKTLNELSAISFWTSLTSLFPCPGSGLVQIEWVNDASVGL